MSRIPPPALWLGLAGLLPFLYGAAVALGLPAIAPALGAEAVLRAYGAAILGFMGGCLWGFACAGGRAPRWDELGIAVVPGLWAFASAFHPAPLWSLLAGFVVLLAIDMIFVLRGLAPGWWMALRLPLTGGVVLCLGLAAVA